jgi:hypothetical protein
VAPGDAASPGDAAPPGDAAAAPYRAWRVPSASPAAEAEPRPERSDLRENPPLDVQVNLCVCEAERKRTLFARPFVMSLGPAETTASLADRVAQRLSCADPAWLARKKLDPGALRNGDSHLMILRRGDQENPDTETEFTLMPDDVVDEVIDHRRLKTRRVLLVCGKLKRAPFSPRKRSSVYAPEKGITIK